MSEEKKTLDVEAVRGRLKDARGRDYWRSLDELAETAEFQDLLEREFPRQAIGWSEDENPVEGRRNFLKLMAASLALGGLAACTRQPTEHIAPYVRQPEDLTPGRPLFYATASTLNGIASGILAESHEGRPTKIEGNPEHPATLGACDAFSQAGVLQLYDPDRMQALTYRGEIQSWGSFMAALREVLGSQKANNGFGLRILTETVTSPSMADQLSRIQKLYPAMKWIQWEPAGAHSGREGSMMAFAQPVNTYYDLRPAKVVVSLDSDFLASGPASLRYARQFAAGRRVRGTETAMNRLYVVEPMLTPTGSKADHRLPLRAAEVEIFAGALMAAVGSGQGPTAGDNAELFSWIGPVARDLLLNKGACVVFPGEHQSPAVHAMAHVMNAALGNVGKTVFYTDPLEAKPVNQLADLQQLAADLNAGQVGVLLILGGNPVFNGPVELALADSIAKAKTSIHLSLYDNETSAVCDWRLPEAHFLESWGDARAFDGTVTPQQPLIEPLYGGRSQAETLQLFTESPSTSGRDILKNYWAAQHPGADFEAWWRRSLHDGLIAGSALPPKTPAIHGENIKVNAQAPRLGGKLEVIFRPDPTIYDGRFANNGWLQELPKPLTKLTWDNAAILGPATATRLGVASGDMLQLTYQGRSLRAPVWIQPGHADAAVTLHLGYGRTRAGRAGTGMGFNPYGLRTAKALWHDVGLDAKKIAGKYEFASTMSGGMIDWRFEDTKRHIIHKGDIEDYRKNPASVHEGAEVTPKGLTLYPEWKYPGHSWGMGIDLTSCTGCNACIVACQAENNIAVVGKDQVRRGRDMHWLRVDNYYQGDATNPEVSNQPLPCMHCENAPCELVCPVQATNHSSEGLNDMVYNRCVGTRYCQNNCPYKVRKFNFYLYSDYETPSLQLLHNPDVTVRSRGVMEKCTYCVQRINAAKIDAEKADRPLKDGDIQTACQASCPTEAIIFGDLNDKNSRVSKMREDRLNYELLGELNTRPRTTYLAHLRNPNPEMEG